MIVHNHKLDELPAVISCIAQGIQWDRPEKGDPLLAQYILEGKLEIKRSAALWWVDEDFEHHFVCVHHGELMPTFRIVDKPEYEIKVPHFGCIEWKTRNARYSRSAL